MALVWRLFFGDGLKIVISTIVVSFWFCCCTILLTSEQKRTSASKAEGKHERDIKCMNKNKNEKNKPKREKMRWQKDSRSGRDIERDRASDRVRFRNLFEKEVVHLMPFIFGIHITHFTASYTLYTSDVYESARCCFCLTAVQTILSQHHNIP